jgi:hypothetical protein
MPRDEFNRRVAAKRQGQNPSEATQSAKPGMFDDLIPSQGKSGWDAFPRARDIKSLSDEELRRLNEQQQAPPPGFQLEQRGGKPDITKLSDAELRALSRQQTAGGGGKLLNDAQVGIPAPPPGFQLENKGDPWAAYPRADAPVTASGAAKQFGVGVGKGAIGLGTFGGDIREYLAKGLGNLTGGNPQLASTLLRGLPLMGGPTSAQTQAAIERLTGEFRKPQNTAEQYAQTAGEFLPAVLNPVSHLERGKCGGRLDSWAPPGVPSTAC